MLITYYDPITFQRKGTITRVNSVTWNKRFFDTGSFEIHTRDTDISKNDLILHGDNCGIVMEIIKKHSGDVEIYGYDLKGISEFRYVTENIIYEDAKPEYIFKDLAKAFFLKGDRTITGLLVSQNQGRGEIIEKFETGTGYLSEIFSKLSKLSEMSFDITFNERNIIFDVAPVRNNTITTFSKRNHTIDVAELEQNAFNTYNVIYSTTEESEIISKGTAKGIQRRESYTDKPESIDIMLSDKAETESLNATITQYLKYGIDYKIGDYVSIGFDDYISNQLITEIEINYNRGSVSYVPTFGIGKENIIKKLLKG